jgi:hypothetical protein
MSLGPVYTRTAYLAEDILPTPALSRSLAYNLLPTIALTISIATFHAPRTVVAKEGAT